MDKFYKLDELIIGAGGIKGIYIVGCLYNLDQIHPLKYFNYYTGCSVGSILCFLLNLGYTIKEIEEIINIDFKDYQDLKLINLMNSFGFDDGSKITNLLIDFIIKKNFDKNITFKELYKKTKKILTFVVTNMTTGTAEYHNYRTKPDMPIFLSLRMSINVPILYPPVKYQDNYYVDGGVLDPYPYNYHKKTKKIGIMPIAKNDYNFLRDKETKFVDDIEDTSKYLKNLFYIVYLSHFKTKISGYKKNTIMIITDEGKEFFDFDINNEEREVMLNNGKISFNTYFKQIYIKRRRRYLTMKYYFLWKNKIIKEKNNLQ